ncbi:hypothetical protein ACFYWS_11970 [Streptomyces sp. NPDC002795]|uniref:hypothetical protein n=1 Tax=Streptomyces sp. NPDC002795 TaxID=3364665 RepID=UPI0036A5F49F
MGGKKFSLDGMLHKAWLHNTSLLQGLGAPPLGTVTKPGVLHFASVLREARTVLGPHQAYLAPTQHQLQVRAKLADASEALHIDPKRVHLVNHLGVADWFLNLMHRVDYPAYTAPELRAKWQGLRGVFGGEGFELLSHGHEKLHITLDRLAAKERWAMNQLVDDVKDPSKQLVDARGTPVTDLSGSFGPPMLALDIWIHQPGGRKVKFVDTARTSYFMPSDQVIDTLYLGLLSGAEIKLPGAALSVGPQIARIQDRFSKILAVEMTVPGQFKSAVFFPEQILFNGAGTKYSAIAPRGIPGMLAHDVRTTTSLKGGPLDFDQYYINVDVHQLMFMIDLLFTI